MFRISFYAYAKISLIYLSLLTGVSHREFKTASLFIVVIFATNFDVMLKDHLFCSQILKQTCT